ncbi:DUF192 domain-containing protein [Haloterrigena alkaliphila]|uniref:DUF192 domain-containing protein n=1 Tax=Haloterrigena alkaliphila TaxID=2816475 RepID=A0A8A2VR07_9EURY|nr:DUF192 domain-containing protein [Haloterrigena alkaliphila]QSX00519.1 DUF192 domain-containing protein [Haloterrigena alkaliphila]
MHDGVTRRRLLGVSGAVAVAGCLGEDDSAQPNDTDSNDSNDSNDENESTIHEEYDTTEVRAVSADGDELGSVTAAIADTDDLRYLGLSDTEDLPADRGMLFVFESASERTFVMREMDFGIDIVYADEDGTITGIHHAPAPGPDEDGGEQEYPGRGQYVLEVVYEWTTDHDVSEGDVLEFDLEA